MENIKQPPHYMTSMSHVSVKFCTEIVSSKYTKSVILISEILDYNILVSFIIHYYY